MAAHEPEPSPSPGPTPLPSAITPGPARARPAPDGSGARLRLARLARGMPQEELARASAVTRQAIAGIEGGRWDPSLRVALAIARALDTPVEDLFGPEPSAPAIPVTLPEPVGPGTARLQLARVSGKTLAFPLQRDATMRCGFLPAGGLVHSVHGLEEGLERDAHAVGAWRSTLLVAGCDPALPLLEAPLGRLDPPVGFAWWPCGSSRALELLARGAVHVAGVHRALSEPDAPTPRPPIADSRLRELREQGAELVGFAAWREGLLVHPRYGQEVHDLRDVARLRLRLANREPGAEARGLLDRERERLGISTAALPGYRTQARAHLLLASAIASGLADAGIATEPAARAYGLDFLPLARERFELVIPREQMGTQEVQALLHVLTSRSLQAQLGSLDGYDASMCAATEGR